MYIFILVSAAVIGCLSPYLLGLPYNVETAFEQRNVLNEREIAIEADLFGGYIENNPQEYCFYLTDAPNSLKESETVREKAGFSIDLKHFQGDFDFRRLSDDFKKVETDSRNIYPYIKVIVKGKIRTNKLYSPVCFNNFPHLFEVSEIRKIGEIRHFKSDMETP